MIIRILGEGQYLVDAELLATLNDFDQAIEQAALANDQAKLSSAMSAILAAIRQAPPVPDDIIAESELILPDESVTVDQVLELLDQTSEYTGLIPDEG